MINDLAKKVELLILDVDGVMTDGSIIINSLGEEMKFFNVRDGQGLVLLMKEGIEVAIITGRESKAVARRAAEIGINEVIQGAGDKKSFCKRLIERKGLRRDQVCCIGDDLPDISMFTCIDFPIAVADAPEEVRSAALYVTTKNGGKGAVREVCEIILKAKGLWPKIISDFT